MAGQKVLQNTVPDAVLYRAVHGALQRAGLSDHPADPVHELGVLFKRPAALHEFLVAPQIDVQHHRAELQAGFGIPPALKCVRQP